MNAVPTISTHTARDLQPPQYPRYAGKVRQPTMRAVERICERIATERGLTVNNVLYGYGAANKSARRDAFKAILAETGCSISGLADTLGRARGGIYVAMAYVDRPISEPKTPAAPKPPRALPTYGQCVMVSQAVRDEVLAEVHRETGVPPRLILSRDKRRTIYRARAEALWRLRAMERADGTPRYSFPVLGRTFGIHHTAAMNAIEDHAGRVSA